jgi:hypothetical protein
LDEGRRAATAPLILLLGFVSGARRAAHGSCSASDDLNLTRTIHRLTEELHKYALPDTPAD